MGRPLKNRLDELLAEQRRLVGLLEANGISAEPPAVEPEPQLPGVDTAEAIQALSDALDEAGVCAGAEWGREPEADAEDQEPPRYFDADGNPIKVDAPQGHLTAVVRELRELRADLAARETESKPDTRTPLEMMSDALDTAGMFRSGRWAPNGADDDA
jgi:hypothetical protein